jgi:hypothetical protein
MPPMKINRLSLTSDTFLLGCLLGLAGGLAEILWITLYGALTGSEIAEVARSISAVVSAFVPVAPLITEPVASGIAIHMIAAIGLGIALAFVWRALSVHWAAAANGAAFMLLALTIVWGINFFVVLPLLNPYFVDLNTSFVELIPYPASLISKLMFGLTAAVVLEAKADGQSVPVRN